MTNTAQSASAAEDLAGGRHQREMSTIHIQQLHTEHKQSNKEMSNSNTCDLNHFELTGVLINQPRKPSFLLVSALGL